MPRRWTADGVFVLVRDGLVFFSQVTGRTYVEMNIIAYFIVIPGSWLVLLDMMIGTRGGLTFLFLLVWLFLCLRKTSEHFPNGYFKDQSTSFCFLIGLVPTMWSPPSSFVWCFQC